MSEWAVILDESVTLLARVWVYDKGQSDSIGRYVVSKLMRLRDGQTRRSQSYYFQRPAALRYAKHWLAARAALVPQRPNDWQPFVYLGEQTSELNIFPSYHIFRLTEDVDYLGPKDTTCSEATLRAAGFNPQLPIPTAAA